MPKNAVGLLVAMALLLSACSQEKLEPTVEPTELPFPLPGTLATPLPDTAVPTEAPDVVAPDISTETSAPQIDAPQLTSQPEVVQLSSATAATRYILQIGSPVTMANFVVPEAGCNWLGVGGQAFDINGNPVANLVVEVGGTLEGSEVFQLALTGSSTNLGPGGFIINLADHVADSSGTLWVILYNLAGEPVTSRISFRTYADCTKNFIMINYVEMNADFVDQITLPLIRK